MSTKHMIGISLFLVTLVFINIFFFYNLSSERSVRYIAPQKLNDSPNVFKGIDDCMIRLSGQYRIKNSQFRTELNSFVQAFNTNHVNNLKTLWSHVENVSNIFK